MEDISLTLSHSLNPASDSSLNYAVLTTKLEDAESSCLRVELPVYSDAAKAYFVS